ncbi:hypothetical protein BN2497_4225 [Janthinobacterium sp. CG23_2]|nr:hypothetical protein BN2497_4225 [Janthinobacterium sp. CG23_2]CUU28510.1 hypothetical protein BN3177_4225 [Janthinobacterium sp. CG23_2]
MVTLAGMRVQVTSTQGFGTPAPDLAIIPAPFVRRPGCALRP